MRHNLNFHWKYLIEGKEVLVRKDSFSGAAQWTIGNVQPIRYSEGRMCN